MLGELRENAAFGGNGGGEDVVKGGNAICGEDQQRVWADRVHVADFAAVNELKRRHSKRDVT